MDRATAGVNSFGAQSPNVGELDPWVCDMLVGDVEGVPLRRKWVRASGGEGRWKLRDLQAATFGQAEQLGASERAYWCPP